MKNEVNNFPPLFYSTVFLLFMCNCLTAMAQDTIRHKRPHSFFIQPGFQFGSGFVGSVSLHYIHPDEFGIRATYRNYYRTPENEPLDFRECNSGWFTLFKSGPFEEANIYELVLIKRIQSQTKKVAFTLAAGPHFSRFKEIHYSKPPHSTCYITTSSIHSLPGLSANLGLEFSFTRYFGIQFGLNGLLNSKRILFGPEIGMLIGKIR